jgi:hypothetical protein
MPRVSLSNRLRDWCSRWQLQGDVIACQACMMACRASEPDRAFVHGLNCRLQTGQLQYPWRELAESMARLPRLKARPGAQEAETLTR